MADAKRLTDAELDEFARQNGLGCLFAIDEATRLIAQAREANRLRDVVDSARRLALKVINNLREDYSWAPRARELATSVLEGDDPAARAKRELGEWLVAKHPRAWCPRVWPNGAVEIMLWDEYVPDDAPDHIGFGPTEHEAITAALAAARKAEG